MGLFLLSTHTASTSATLDITSGIDSTYNEYQIQFVNLHPGEDSRYPAFRASIDGGSNYDVAVMTSYNRAYHFESDSDAAFTYVTDYDSVGTDGTSGGNVFMAEDTGADSDQAWSGFMTLYAPSSTTFVKHFIMETNTSNGGNAQANQLIGGYMNTTSAVNAIRFLFSSGNIDSGTIYLYGVG